MTRRGFLKAIFKMTAIAPAVPVIIKNGPSWIERCLDWFQKKCRPIFRWPLIRRVFPEFNVHEFVTVQPMSTPSALVFYTDFIYQGKKVESPGPSKPYDPADYVDYPDFTDIKE